MELSQEEKRLVEFFRRDKAKSALKAHAEESVDIDDISVANYMKDPSQMNRWLAAIAKASKSNDE